VLRPGGSLLNLQVEKSIDVLEQNFPEDGLVPLYVDPNTGKSSMDKISFGAMGDR
jgi:mannosyl-oligosaccharide alpha-1,2-mannosidase